MNNIPKIAQSRKKPTMGDVAHLAGVSKPTVSRVMNGSTLVTDETRQKVLTIARDLGYSVNSAARRLWQNRANTIAVVIDMKSLPEDRLSQPFHFELLADVLKALTDVQQDALLVSLQTESAAGYQSIVASQRVDGIIFIGQGTRLSMLRDLAATSTPFVAWGAPDEFAPYCTVGSDNFQGGLLAGARLSQTGRTRILFVGRLEHREIRLRRNGLEAGLMRSGGTFQIVDVLPDDLSYAASVNAMTAYLNDAEALPDGIFCASDTTAMAVLSVLRDRNLAIPQDVSVIGYDDIPQATQHRPALTTIRQDTRMAGALLVSKLMEYVAGDSPASVTLPTELVARDSG